MKCYHCAKPFESWLNQWFLLFHCNIVQTEKSVRRTPANSIPSKFIREINKVAAGGSAETKIVLRAMHYLDTEEEFNNAHWILHWPLLVVQTAERKHQTCRRTKKVKKLLALCFAKLWHQLWSAQGKPRFRVVKTVMLHKTSVLQSQSLQLWKTGRCPKRRSNVVKLLFLKTHR